MRYMQISNGRHGSTLLSLFVGALAFVLGFTGSGRWELLSQALAHQQDEVVRVTIIDASSAIDGPIFGESVFTRRQVDILLLEDDAGGDLIVCALLIDALGELPDDEVDPPLIQAMREGSYFVESDSTLALRRVNPMASEPIARMHRLEPKRREVVKLLWRLDRSRAGIGERHLT